MVIESELAVRLQRLQTELQADLVALTARADEARSLRERWEATGTINRPELVLIAVNLHAWYTAAEAAYDRIARLLDQTVPEGSSWHVDLLAQMRIEVPGLRPAVIPPEVLRDMHELRRFRHFFRNAYVLDLDPAKIADRVSELLRARDPVTSGLRALQQHLERVAAEIR